VSAAVYSDFGNLPADLRALIDRAGALDFQASTAWFSHFVAEVAQADPLPPGAGPAWHVWREQGQAVAALPLIQQPGLVRSLGNYYTTRYAPVWAEGASPAQARGWLAALLRAVLQAAPGTHTLRFEPMAQGGAAEAALRGALRDNACAVFDFHAFQNWTLPVTTDWPSYRASRDGRLRTTLARMGKRFAARGGRLELLLGGPALAPAALERGIAAYQAVYAASWKPPEPDPGFMPGLIRTAAQAGVLRLGLAWVGEQPVAAQVWMVAGGRADIYKLAHDEAHKASSPGTLLTALLMQQAFEVDRVQVVDYLSGDDAYKRLWMSQAQPYGGLIAYRLQTPRGLLGAARAGLEAAVRSITAPQ
jgi:hypothetical protein